MPDVVLFEVHGPVATITLNRPDALNAMNAAMYHRLNAVFDLAEADDQVRVVIVTGAGTRAFAAGADIAEFESLKDAEDVHAYEQRVHHTFGRLERLSKPTIAAIRGFCTGGGTTIAAACDLRIAADDVKLGIPIARTLGNFISQLNLARLVDLIGPARTKEMLMTAKLYTAPELLAAGMVSEVVAPDDLMPRAQELAEHITKLAPLTLSAAKTGIRRILDQRSPADDQDLMLMCYLSEDFREGVRAFVSKRKPVWVGR